MNEMDEVLSVPDAAKQAGVSRNTMLLAAKNGKIKAKKLGRFWFVYSSDIERWYSEQYKPDMAYRYPIKGKEGNENE